MSHLRDLDRADCLDLITRGTVGRAAVSTAEGPHIVPVAYALVDDAVVIRTSPYSVLGTTAPDSVVAFEIDHVDDESRTGWSVMVRGRCSVETDSPALARVREALGEPWVSGARTLYLRLPLEHVSGRVLGAAVDTAPGGSARG